MVRVNAPRQDNGVLPFGGQLGGTDRGDHTVDKSNAIRLFKKKPGSANSPQNVSNIFNPVEPNQTRPASHKGKDLHTDPFAADRNHYSPPTKVLKKLEAKEPHKTGIMQVKPNEPKHPKNELVTANGIVFGRGKVVHPELHESTMDRDQPSKDYGSMARFRTGGSVHRSTAHVVAHDTSINGPKDLNQAHHNGKSIHKSHDEGSLMGVLRQENKKPARQFAYRPPWGTCNTPRAAPTGRTANYVSPTPWATNSANVEA